MSAISVSSLSDVGDAGVLGYRLEAPVARRSGVGASYRARRLRDGERVLLTVASPEAGSEPASLDRFERWTGMRSRFSHPVLPRVVEAGAAGAGLYIAVEEPEGSPLSELLADGPLPPARVLAILAPVADLLEQSRASGAAVMCPPPHEIIVGPGDRPTVTDLGILDLGTRHRRAEVGDDDVDYMAPEQLRGLPSGARTDVYNLAVIAFEALTGTRPFRELSGSGDPDVVARALKVRHALPAPAVSARRAGLGPAVDAVLKRALGNEVRLRPSSPLALMERLRAAFAKAPGGRRPARASLTATRGSRPDASAPKLGGPLTSRAPGPDELPRTGITTAWARPAADPPREWRSVAGLDVRALGHRTRLALTIGAALLAAAAGSALALGDEPPRSAPAVRTVAASEAIALEHPSTWGTVTPARRLAALPLRHGVTLAPRDASGRRDVLLVAGVVESTDEHLLPPALARRLDAEPVAEPVRLGAHAAYRYADLRLRDGEREVTLYVMPTTVGVATVACLARAATGAPGGDCEAIATTIELRRGRALPLGPSARFADSVDGALRRLDVRRRAGRGQLAQAETVAGQGRRAEGLARAFEQARDEVEDVPRVPGTATLRARLATELAAVGSSYRALAAAAAGRDRAGYVAARAAVARREARLSGALASLRRLGYRIG